MASNPSEQRPQSTFSAESLADYHLSLPFNPQTDVLPNQWEAIDEGERFYRSSANFGADWREALEDVILFKALSGKEPELHDELITQIFNRSMRGYPFNGKGGTEAYYQARAAMMLPPDVAGLLPYHNDWDSLVNQSRRNITALLREYEITKRARLDPQVYAGTNVLRSTAPLALLFPDEYPGFKEREIDSNPVIFAVLKKQQDKLTQYSLFVGPEYWDDYAEHTAYLGMMYPERKDEIKPYPEDWKGMKQTFNKSLAGQDINPGGISRIPTRQVCEFGTSMILIANNLK